MCSVFLILIILLQDPYVRLTVHNASAQLGQIVKTTAKENAGGNAKFNEKFVIDKPGCRTFNMFYVISVTYS